MTTADFEGEAANFWTGLRKRFPGKTDSQILLDLKRYVKETTPLRRAAKAKPKRNDAASAG